MHGTEVAELAHEFADIGAQLRGDGDNDGALLRITELAVKHVPGCAWASVILLNGQARSLASSDPVAARADSLRHDLGEGPWLHTAACDTDVVLIEVTAERRWPHYSRALLDRTPIRTVLTLRLAAERAALNLYSAQPNGFTGESIDVAAILAAHVSSAVALHLSEENATNLRVALASSRQIGVAVGILMAYHRVTEQDAFDLLRAASQNLNIKLRELAASVIETGALPEPLPPTTRAPWVTVP